MSTITAIRKNGNGNGGGLAGWLTPVNLHWAGVGLLVAVNLYVLVRMGLLWHESGNYSPTAMSEQRVEKKTAEIAAVPMRGMDTKLATATAEADRFYRDRLPGSYSGVAAELGALTKKAGVRLTRVQYSPQQVLVGLPGELTEVRMDATLAGDYRPLMEFINSLERDKMFFVIQAVTLTGQQSGTVNLRLRLTTYLRPGAPDGPPPTEETAAAEGGPAR